METNMVLSVGSIFAAIGLFYTFIKDSRHQAEEMANLKARVNSLESKTENTDIALQQLLTSVQDIKVALAKIDTKLSLLENEFHRDKK